MVVAYQTKYFQGPWKGTEFREPKQTDQHDGLRINIDGSRGLIEGRRPFAVLDSANVGRRARLHVTYSPDGKQWLLAVGMNDGKAPTTIRFACFDLAGILQGTAQNLTTDFGESPTVNFDCSFVEQTLSVGGDAHHVTLIVTPSNNYVFDPLVSLSTVRLLNTGADAIRMNAANFAYWDNVPHGRIAVEHQGRVYYSGFPPGYTASLSKTLEEDQNMVPETLVSGDRSHLAYGPQHVVYTDEFDPASVQVHHVFSVEEHEKVTGLVSFQEQLVIFTDRSIYVMSGGTDESFAIRKVVSGVGCVAPHSIVDVNGTLFWMSHDGVWAWGGGAAPERLSAPVEALWTGRWDKTFVPELVGQDTLKTLGWPWTVRWGDLPLCQSMVWREGHQIWWSLPIQSRDYMAFPVTLVFDWEAGSWGFFSQSPTTNADASCMYDGVTVPQGNGRELILTSAGVTNQWLQTPNVAVAQDAAAALGVPVVWISGRIDKPNDAKSEYRKVRLKLLSTAKIPATNPPKWFAVGGESHHDVGSTTRQEQSGNLTLHPDETKTYFLGTGFVLGTSKIAGRDWFSSNVKSAVRSRWTSWGFVDDAKAEVRPPFVVMQSWSVEVRRGPVDE